MTELTTGNWCLCYFHQAQLIPRPFPHLYCVDLRIKTDVQISVLWCPVPVGAQIFWGQTYFGWVTGTDIGFHLNSWLMKILCKPICPSLGVGGAYITWNGKGWFVAVAVTVTVGNSDMWQVTRNMLHNTLDTRTWHYQHTLRD